MPTDILLRSRENILSDLVRSILANSDLSDVSVGSTLSILLDALSSTLYQNQLLVLKVLESTSLENLIGVDLDRYAASIGLPNTIGGVGRKGASTSSGNVTISSSFTELDGVLFNGKPAPFAGSTTIYIQNASSWPTNGSLYIGRGTASNLEGPIPYTITSTSNQVLYWIINLNGPLTKNHSLSETVTVSQGGDRRVSAGTIIGTTANANSPVVQYQTDTQLIIPDGVKSASVSVTSLNYGSSTNASANSINSFSSVPFVGATVTNPTAFVNGSDTESDEALRQRIRDYPSTLARGTANAIVASLLGLSDPATGKTIVSVVVVEPTSVNEPSFIYINDGGLLEPSFSPQSYELLLSNSSGQETLFNTAQFPITPCVAIGSAVAPFALTANEPLTVTIDGITETYTVTESNYVNLSSVSSFEIIRDFNAQANIATFRTIGGGNSIVMFDKSGTSEIMTINSGELQTKLGFTTEQIRPIFLYKNDKLLSFKGSTATLTTSNYPWNLLSTDMINVQVQVDSTIQTFSVTNTDFSPFFQTIQTATLKNWATVLNGKLSGVDVTVVGSSLVWSSYQKNSINSYLKILLDQVTPAAFFAISGVCTIVTAQPHGLTVGASITISGSSINNLDGSFLVLGVSTPNTFTISTTITGSGVLFYVGPNSNTSGWIGINKMWPAPTVLTPLSSQGTAQDYTINRYLGEIQLNEKPNVGDRLEIATTQTRGQINALTATTGVYSISPNIATTGNSRMVVSFDGLYVIKQMNVSIGSVALVNSYPNEKIIRLTAYVGSAQAPNVPDPQLFANASVGDYLYISPDISVQYYFDSSLSSFFLIKDIAEDKTWIEFEVSSLDYTAFTNPPYAAPNPFIYDISNITFNLFSSTSTPQVVDFGTAATVTVDTAISIINNQIKSGSAQKLSSTNFVIRSNSYVNGSAAVLAVIGNAQNIFSTGIAASIQPHEASVKSGDADFSFPIFTLSQKTDQSHGKATRGYITSSYNLTNVISTGVNPTIESDVSVLSYPIGSQELWVTGKLSGYTGRTYQTNQTAPFQGFLRTDEYISNIGTFDATPPYYYDYRNISLKCQAMQFSPTDTMVFVMDNNDVGKTINVPMAKIATILSIDPITGGGLGQTINCQLADPNDIYLGSPKPFFNQYSPFQTFNLEDFRILTKSVGVYKVTGGDRALVLRSTSYGATNRLKLSIRYPLAANQSTLQVSHKEGFANNIPETYVLVYLTSGAIAQSINSGILNIEAIPYISSPGLAAITFNTPNIDSSKFLVGNILNFSGNHPLSGAYEIIDSGTGFATVLAPGLLNYSTAPITGLTLSTQSSSSTVEITENNHGLATGDLINIVATADCNGITASNLSVSSAPITVVDANNYTYVAASNANGPAGGTMTMSFPVKSLTITATPGSATVLVSQTGHNLITGDQINITSAPSAGLGGISKVNLEVSSAFVTYVNANGYSYSALAPAPSQTASVQISRSDNVTFDTAAASNKITVHQNNHDYASGANIQFSGVVSTIDGIAPSYLNILTTIIVQDVNTYYFYIGTQGTIGTSGNAITATYSPPSGGIGALTITPNSTLVTVQLIGHNLITGAVINLTALAGAGGLTSAQLSVTNAPIIVLNNSQFTYNASIAAPAISGSANIQRVSNSISVSIPNGFQTTAGIINATLNNHHLLTGDTMTFSAVSSIGGISTANLAVSAIVGNTLIVNDINTFTFFAAAASPIQTTTVSVTVPLVLSATQYPISTYPVIGKSVSAVAAAITAYLPSNPIATCQAIGTNTATNLITDATYIDHPQLTPFTGPNSTIETNYDWHSFSCKYSGYADVYTYPQPSQFASLSLYNAAISGNAVQLLAQTIESLFPTTTDAAGTPYTPVGESVYIVPTNGRTLHDWLSFSAISSLSVLATVDSTNSLSEVQVSSQLQGSAGAVHVKGVTANSASMFVTGVGTTLYDPITINDGGNGASKVSVGYASVLPFVSGSVVKVTNNQLTQLSRPYRTIPTGNSITSSNDVDTTHFFRSSTEIDVLAITPMSTRLLFKRFGLGTGQTEPLTMNDSVSSLTVNFTLFEPDNITPLSPGVVLVTLIDPTNTAKLAARTGDMMVIRGSTIINLFSAIFQGTSGNTVRYTLLNTSNSMGLVVGENVFISGFTNSQNNSLIGLTIVDFTNTYVDVTNINRIYGDGKDETNPATLNFGSLIPAYISPFTASVQCRPIIDQFMTNLEYLGYPVVNVYNTNQIAILAPNITSSLSVIIPNTTTNPEYLSSLVFLPAIYNEKNIQTNRNVGPQYQEFYNNGNMNFIVKTLSNGFVSIWGINSSNYTDTMMLDECCVNTDDWATFGTEFALANQGTYKIVAHNGSNQMIIYNPNGGQDELLETAEISGQIGTRAWGVGPFTSPRPIRIIDAESVRVGDLLRISSPLLNSTWLPSNMIGSFPITSIGYCATTSLSGGTFDPTKLNVYVDIPLTNGPSSLLSLTLGTNMSAIGFTGANNVFGFREFIGYTVNPLNPTAASAYLQPDLPDIQFSDSFGTEITSLYKMNFPTSNTTGIDGYISFSGLIQRAHWTIDGVSSNSANYPGVRAAGTQCEVLTPLLKAITVDISITTSQGVDQSTVAQIIQSTVSGYINSLSVGQSVVLSSIIQIVQSLSGVYSVQITSSFPVAQNGVIPVGSVEKAYVIDASKNVVVS